MVGVMQSDLKYLIWLAGTALVLSACEPEWLETENTIVLDSEGDALNVSYITEFDRGGDGVERDTMIENSLASVILGRVYQHTGTQKNGDDYAAYFSVTRTCGAKPFYVYYHPYLWINQKFYKQWADAPYPHCQIRDSILSQQPEKILVFDDNQTHAIKGSAFVAPTFTNINITIND
ncbi:MAG: hypothetical protein ACI30H_09120 [Paludibacteraceae bacterium]